MKLPAYMVYNDDRLVLKQLLGNNISIVDIIINDVIQEEFVIVDVMYNDLFINTNEIFYIESSKLKRTVHCSSKYIFNIQDTLGFKERQFHDFDQNIILSVFGELKKVIPVRINPILKQQSEDELIHYFALVVKNPLTSLITPYKYFQKCIEIYQFTEMIDVKTLKMKPLEESSSSIPESSNLSEDLKIYEGEKNKIRFVSSVELAKDFKDVIIDNPNREVAYVIDFRKIQLGRSESKRTKSLKGIIYISENRNNPWNVLFYPTIQFKITHDELNSIGSFLSAESRNFENFNYINRK
jgi:hypothetical protein